MPATKTIYLDYAAATPVDDRVSAAMQPYFSEKFFNPSATYLAAKRVHQDIEAARSTVARILGARTAEIIFTAGSTEANNVAIHGVMSQYPGKKILVSSIEHESVLGSAHQYECHEIPVHPDGIIDLAALKELIDNDTVLISIMYANNEVGSIQPLQEAATLIKQMRTARRESGNKLPLYFHTDATQAANYMDVHTARLGVDLMVLNGGKIYGPKQSGMLWMRTGVSLRPVTHGGGQEQNLRSGTENVPGIIGFSCALEIATAMRSDEAARLQQLQRLFFDMLAAQIPGVVINGSHKKRLPNNVHITIPGVDNERLLMALDEAGIMAAVGSACQASNEEPSHVLRAMGVSAGNAQASLRFTLGRFTTEQDIRDTVAALTQIIA